MIDFADIAANFVSGMAGRGGVDDTGQAGNTDVDPTQEMIRRALAAAQNQPAAGQPTSGTSDSAANRPAPQSFGERIAGRPTAPSPQPATPQPTRVVVQPQQKPISPGATGILLPTDRDGKTRPSFGRQIGGESSAPLAPSIASVVPQSAPPAALTAGLDRKPVPAAPVGSNNPNLTSALAEQQKFATPLDRNATDASGKKIYKMGLGQRLLGIAANFGAGLAHLDPVEYVGPGATNRRYQTDDDTRKANLEKANLNVAGQEKLDTSNLNLEKLATHSGYEDAMAKARGETAEAQQQRAEAYDTLSKAQAEWRKSQANNLDNKPTSDSRAADADKYGLKGDARRDYILTGKLPKDFASSSRQPTDLEMWHSAFVRENKREPTADEIRDRKAKTRGSPEEFANVEAKKQQALSAAEGGYRKAVSQSLTDDDKKDALDDLNEAKTRAQSAYEQEIRSLGGDAGAGTTSTAAATPASTAARTGKIPPKPVAPPPKPTSAAPTGKVWVYEKATGKRGLIPASQLPIATKGGNAKYGTW